MITLKCHFLLEEAKKRWIQIEFIDKEIPLFFLKKWKKKILFQDSNGWANSSLGRRISKEKEYTYKVLEYYNIPCPKTIIFRNQEKLDKKYILKQIQYPLVVKPSDRWCGKWISIVFHDKQMNKAIKEAKKFSKTIIIQEFILWDEHRVMVVDKKVIAWLKRIPASIVWDGKHTIKRLIQEKNELSNRWETCNVAITTKIKTDAISKEYTKNRYWYISTSIPKKKEIVYLRGNSNLSTWWDAMDITDIIHPKFKKICCKIARICKCPIAGVDVIVPDITKDPDIQKWAIIEINSGAQYNIHQTDTFGKPRNVAWALLDFYFKE